MGMRLDDVIVALSNSVQTADERLRESGNPVCLGEVEIELRLHAEFEGREEEIELETGIVTRRVLSEKALAEYGPVFESIATLSPTRQVEPNLIVRATIIPNAEE